ncbi:MAG: glycyl-radical enzyme activating protein [Bacillota bacterium]|nr:glycyl-radical enzyme activating protein [Bacillota bacterium]
MSQVLGQVFNIQSFSIHDGPGIRTTVFLQGCNLHCLWCHNPESVSPGGTLLYRAERCVGCGNCVAACPHGAHTLTAEGHTFDRSRCARCWTCVATCYAGALERVGQTMTVDECMAIVRADVPYFALSGGGVTVSGGEPLLQPDFTVALLAACREAGIHTALDTAGAVSWESFAKTLPFTDLYLIDLKAWDEALHRELTGVSNARTLANFRRLAGLARVRVRIPVVPGLNDGEIPALARFLADYPQVEVEPLAYHSLGEDKRRAMGLGERVFTVPSQERMEAIREQFRAVGLTVIH